MQNEMAINKIKHIGCIKDVSFTATIQFFKEPLNSKMCFLVFTSANMSDLDSYQSKEKCFHPTEGRDAFTS